MLDGDLLGRVFIDQDVMRAPGGSYGDMVKGNVRAKGDDLGMIDDRIQNFTALPKAGGSCLILLMRHLGDAVIASGVINALHRHNPSMTVDILGWPELKGVATSFSHFGEYIEIDLPVFGHHRKNLTALRTSFRAIRLVQRRDYDYCINLVGDIRENLIGRVTGAKWNIAPVWERGHLFKNKMTDRNAGWLANRGIRIPAAYANYYDSLQHFAKQLGLQSLEWRTPPVLKEGRAGVRTIALHPGASHASRHWPKGRWKALIRELHAHGYSIKALGAPSERDGLLTIFCEEIADCRIEVSTEEMPGLLLSLSEADVLIGMDSFSVHAAYALGVPVVVLNGSADPSIMTPPGGMVISAGHLCKQFPCYYGYPCRRTESEYICVRGIEVSMVMTALEAIVERCRGESRYTSKGYNVHRDKK